MSNGTRKKKVDFKKLLITEEESKISFRKKSTKSSNTLQNISNKKEKSQKNSQKQRENKEKLPEKNIPKKIKIKDLKGKEQITLNEFTNKLKNFKDELIFLNKKRNSDMNIEKILNFQKNRSTKIIGAINTENKNENKNKKNGNNLNNINDINSNEDLGSKSQNIQKNENQNQNSALIIDFYKLYLHLFESNRLDNSKPYKFVDYLIAGDNLLFNIKKDKTKVEEIKRGISIKSKNNNFLINDHLLNKYTYEYLKCDFNHSFMKKLIEKINMYIMAISQSQKKKLGIGNNEQLSFEKKDKFTYSNFLTDKLKENSNKSILSFTNDSEYFKSLIYVCNKYSKYIGKKEIPEKILIESLEKNIKILEKFKTEGEDKNLAMKEEKEYLNDLLKNKSIRKYINKKFKIFDEETIKTNKILNGLNINIFYKFIEIMLKNKSDDDIDKLYKIFQEEFSISNDDKIEKNDLKNFFIEFRILLELEMARMNFNNNENKTNEISIMKKLYEYINKFIVINIEKNTDIENISGRKGKSKNKFKLKSKIESLSLENISESFNSDINNNDNSITNIENNNEMIIEPNENNFQNKQNNSENKYDNNINTNNQNKKSKIVPFKIPYPRNNSNANSNISNNNSVGGKNNNQNINLIKSGLFEINTINNSNDSQNDNINTKSIFNNIIDLGQDKKEENKIKINAHFETEKQENTKQKSKRRRKRKNNNENNLLNESNEISNERGRNKNNNNYITLNNINSSILKDIGIKDVGKYLLNKLSSGEDIFKLVVEKPKIKKIKEKEVIEEKEEKEEKENEMNISKEEKEKDNIDLKETTKEIYRKEAETRENSSKSTYKNEKIETNPQSPISNENFEKNKDINTDINSKSITTDLIFSKHKQKNRSKNNKNINNSNGINILNIIDNQRNIDTIKLDNSLNDEYGINSINEITRNDILHSPNIGIKITRKKDNEIILSSNKNKNKILFINKIKHNDKGNKNNLNIQIDRQSVEIKGGKVILNIERENSSEDILKFNDSLNTS